MALLESESIAKEFGKIDSNWQVREGKFLEKSFKFKDFKAAMRFINQIAVVAEELNHHPDIYVYYNRVKLSITNHAEHGLTAEDFALAKKIDLIEL